MTASLIPTPVMQFLDANGAPLVGGKVYTYAAGTSTPLETYTDQGGATPNANPVILNSRGEAAIWFGALSYKLILKTSADVLIWTADNVTAALAALAASSGSSLIGFIASGTGAVARTVQSKERDIVSVKDFGAVGDGTANDTTAIQAAENALSTIIGSSANGTRNGSLLFPPGKYKITSGLLKSRTTTWEGYGAELSFTALSASSTAISIYDTANGTTGTQGTVDNLVGFVINGPGSGTAGTIGVLVGKTGDYIAHEVGMRDCWLGNFESGLQQGSNAYLFRAYGSRFANCVKGINLPSGLANAGEQWNFYGCTIEGNTTGVYHRSAALDVNIFGGSIDYNTNYGIDADTSTCYYSLFGTHLESHDVCTDLGNSTAVGYPTGAAYGCTFVKDVGGTGPAINGTNSNITISGGSVRIGSGTQATWFSANGASNCVLENVQAAVTQITTLFAKGSNTAYYRAEGFFGGQTFFNTSAAAQQYVSPGNAANVTYNATYTNSFVPRFHGGVAMSDSLPVANTVQAGWKFQVMNVDGGAAQLTLTRQSADTITLNGSAGFTNVATSFKITPGQTVILTSDGTSVWYAAIAGTAGS